VDAALGAELSGVESRVWRLVNDKKPAEALALCRELAAQHPGLDRASALLARVGVLVRFEDAAHLLDEKQFLAAERIYRDLCEQVPDHPEGYRGLARALLGQGRKLQAVQAYARYQQEVGRRRSSRPD
jgi:predicted Zn-dependent protease